MKKKKAKKKQPEQPQERSTDFVTIQLSVWAPASPTPKPTTKKGKRS
jgi:hypothetical protein